MWHNQLLTVFGSMTYTIPDVCVNVASVDYKCSAWDRVFWWHLIIAFCIQYACHSFVHSGILNRKTLDLIYDSENYFWLPFKNRLRQ